MPLGMINKVGCFNKLAYTAQKQLSYLHTDAMAICIEKFSPFQAQRLVVEDLHFFNDQTKVCVILKI